MITFVIKISRDLIVNFYVCICGIISTKSPNLETKCEKGSGWLLFVFLEQHNVCYIWIKEEVFWRRVSNGTHMNGDCL